MVMIMNFILPVLLFIIGSLVFISNRKYLLVTLLSLEYIVLSLFLFIFIILNTFEAELYFSMMFLTFSVCEGALGLSILVSLIRTHGNNYMQSFNILLC
uniref:NADH-ubiquinone oxidoreductase chain 4L n=1 Tax=Tarnania fenestralis TaxID=397161 RepID=A0A7G7CCV7_9DIPT|nr:NADH dehydrogenase subunit 4L [Tarnania fenestralis]